MKKALAALAALILAAAWTAADDDGAICSTDTDCAQHCPPPADDPGCDGGPQS